MWCVASDAISTKKLVPRSVSWSCRQIKANKQKYIREKLRDPRVKIHDVVYHVPENKKCERTG